MEVISDAIRRITTMGVADVIDILIVAYLIYKAIWFVRRTNSYNLAKGLILILVVLVVSEFTHLTMINFVLRKAVELGLIALLILFQPELRRMLERMGSSFTTNRRAESPVVQTAIAQTVLACSEMSESKTGALLIFERNVKLGAIMNTGTVINADVTAELIKNLFFNKAPLHDGAVIIRGGRVAAAGCVLPLTQSQNLSKDLGMRHRAGIGLSEQSGAISVAVDGMLKRHLSPQMLDKLLHSELVSDEEDTENKNGFTAMLRRLFRVKPNEEKKSDESTI